QQPSGGGATAAAVPWASLPAWCTCWGSAAWPAAPLWRTSTTGAGRSRTCRSRRPRGATPRCHQGDSVDLSPLMWSTQGMKTEATEIFALFHSLYMLIIYMVVGRMLFSHLYSCYV
ncbi:unnamed protein product, partial [Heterosigma akashiwo]